MKRFLDSIKFIWRNREAIRDTVKRIRAQYFIWQDVIDEHGFATLAFIERETARLHAVWRSSATVAGEISLFRQAYPHAKSIVLSLESEEFYGPTKTQVAYQRLRSQMGYLGVEDSGVTGSVLFIAVSVAYLVEVKKIVELP